MVLTEGPDLAPNPLPSAVSGPPLEEHLAQNTLWPEVVKLYGHANHIFSLAADPLGRYLASACKACLASLKTACQLVKSGQLRIQTDHILMHEADSLQHTSQCRSCKRCRMYNG